MKVHFTKIERTAGLFVCVAIAGFFFFTVVVAIKQGWFSPKRHLTTTFAHGDGLHPGTLIQISGLRAGTVESVVLNDDNLIEVKMTVSSQFDRQLRKDSVARVIRPFVIGDKVVEITVGSKEEAPLKEGAFIVSEHTMDVMDLLGGGRLGPYLETVDSLLRNMKMVAEAFADPKRSKALIGLFDEALPTMKDLREMSQQMTVNKNLKKSMHNLSMLTRDVNAMLPAMMEFSKNLPQLGQTTAQTMNQLSVLTAEVNKFLPILSAVAPKLPEASQKSVEALREAVIVLRAMQKSFLLRGAVEDIKEEDTEKVQKDERKPANE